MRWGSRMADSHPAGTRSRRAVPHAQARRPPTADRPSPCSAPPPQCSANRALSTPEPPPDAGPRDNATRSSSRSISQRPLLLARRVPTSGSSPSSYRPASCQSTTSTSPAPPGNPGTPRSPRLPRPPSDPPPGTSLDPRVSTQPRATRPVPDRMSTASFQASATNAELPIRLPARNFQVDSPAFTTTLPISGQIAYSAGGRCIAFKSFSERPTIAIPITTRPTPTRQPRQGLHPPVPVRVILVGWFRRDPQSHPDQSAGEDVSRTLKPIGHYRRRASQQPHNQLDDRQRAAGAHADQADSFSRLFCSCHVQIDFTRPRSD